MEMDHAYWNYKAIARSKYHSKLALSIENKKKSQDFYNEFGNLPIISAKPVQLKIP